MFNLTKKTDKIEAFWKWFIQYKDIFENLAEDRDEKLDLILEHLHEVEPELSIEVSHGINGKGKREIVISAEGDIDKFPIVKEIVAKAPIIEGWQVTAFRQPAQGDFTLEFEGIKLTPSELFFIPYLEENTLDIVIFGEGFKHHDYTTLGHCGLIMLDNLMGEYNSVTKVRHFDFQDLEEITDTREIRPLSDINMFLEAFYQNKN